MIAFCQTPSLGDLSGRWKGTFADSQSSGTLEIQITSTSSGEYDGTFRIGDVVSGTVVGVASPSSLSLVLRIIDDNCPGTFAGHLILEGSTAKGTYSGTDCRGMRSNGVISVERAETGDNFGGESPKASKDHSVPGSSPGKIGYIRGDCVLPERRVRLLASPNAASSTVKEVACGEEVQLLSSNEGWSRIRLKSGEEGFLGDWFVVTKPTPNGSVSRPSRPSTTSGLLIRVIQTEQVPYSTQIGARQVTTNCSIDGSIQTSGNMTSFGDLTTWSATSNPSLRMNCHSQETPPISWNHILNVMLVVTSDRMAYVIACDAAWRWSKCRGLIPGETFSAKRTKGGLKVKYYDEKRKPKEAEYKITSAMVL
jgi:hypothetical protein